MYTIAGIRKNGHQVYKEYTDKNIALFEFDVTMMVAKELTLSENGVILKEYKLPLVEEDKTTYQLSGETAFNTIERTFENKDLAYRTYEHEKERCNWLVLYEVSNGEMQMKKTYVKENIA